MLSFLPGRLRGVLSFILIAVNTILVFIPLMTVALVKLVLPFAGIRELLSKVLIAIASTWVFCNAEIFRLMNKMDWDVTGVDSLKGNEWCLVISNHQSWVDIFIIQTILLRRVPYIKFFLKKELIWVPLMGLAWWALDFPFMKRYSRKFLEKNPHLKGKDVEITRKACEKFKTSPISIMNFVEGTRFTEGKHAKQQSPYQYLLKPKAGGVAFVLGAMGEYLDSILNVTIVYNQGVPNFWEFLCGKKAGVRVHVDKMPLNIRLLGDYDNDPEYRETFQRWVNDLWEEKDRTFAGLLNSGDSGDIETVDNEDAA